MGLYQHRGREVFIGFRDYLGWTSPFACRRHCVNRWCEKRVSVCVGLRAVSGPVCETSCTRDTYIETEVRHMGGCWLQLAPLDCTSQRSVVKAYVRRALNWHDEQGLSVRWPCLLACSAASCATKVVALETPPKASAVKKKKGLSKSAKQDMVSLRCSCCLCFLQWSSWSRTVCVCVCVCVCVSVWCASGALHCGRV